MRMWNVDPSNLCRRHLLGEHVEIHMFIGTLKKGKNVEGYLDGLYDVENVLERHEDLVKEMERRGFDHNSEITDVGKEVVNEWIKNHDNTGNVVIEENKKELKKRCDECDF